MRTPLRRRIMVEPTMLSKIGRYRIVKPLGRGAMGMVFLADDPSLNRQVAIKMLDIEAESDKDREFLRDRLLRDARAAAVLSHPNIVGVYDIIEDDGTVYVVMEYIEGETLSEYLDRNPAPELPFVIQVVRQMAAGLDYTHTKGIIHRDVKPGNVMIAAGGAVKILDFGIARMTDTRTSTPTGIVMGTIDYMAPEQIKAEAMDGRADQFSLAAVAYRMLTGSTLFGRHTLATLAYKLVNEAPKPVSGFDPSIPAQVDRVLGKALSKNPGDRYATCTAFADELAQAWAGALEAPTAAITLQMPAKKSRSLVPLVVGLALVAAGAAGLTIWRLLPVPVSPPPIHASIATALPEEEIPEAPAPPPKPTPVKTVAKPAPAPVPEERPYQRGLANLQKQDYDAAIREFSETITRHPKMGNAYFERGLAWQLSGRFAKAIEDYSTALHSGHADVKTYTNRGICEARMHQDAAALQDLNTALTIDHVHAPALNARGNLYMRRQQYRKAMLDFDAATAVRPDFALAYENRARAKEALGDTAGAATDLAIAERLRKSR